MNLNDKNKEIDDIVRPIPNETSRLKLVAITVISTVGIVLAVMWVAGYFSAHISSDGSTSSVFSSDCISASDAKSHAGENISVCGVVVSATYASRTKGSPTFLNLDRPYPNQVFTIVIWGSDRSKFGTPESDFRGKKIRVKGLVKMYRGSPEIIASDPSQITSE